MSRYHLDANGYFVNPDDPTGMYVRPGPVIPTGSPYGSPYASPYGSPYASPHGSPNRSPMYLGEDYNYDSTNTFRALYRSFKECQFIEDEGPFSFPQKQSRNLIHLCVQVMSSSTTAPMACPSARWRAPSSPRLLNKPTNEKGINDYRARTPHPRSVIPSSSAVL